MAVLDTRPLFAPLHAELMSLLRSLTPGEWETQALDQWTVRDVAAHLLDGDARQLTYRRDREPVPAPDREIDGFDSLSGFLDDLNRVWVRAAKRIGPRLMVDLLELTGRQVSECFEAQDLEAPAFFGVAWAGDQSGVNWMDVGREYDERWHHQQQIRQATGRPLLTEPRWLAPILRVALHAVPRAYNEVACEPGTEISLIVRGPSGGRWTVASDGTSWLLEERPATNATASVSLDEETAWRLLHGAGDREKLAARITRSGDPGLAAPFDAAFALMA